VSEDAPGGGDALKKGVAALKKPQGMLIAGAAVLAGYWWWTRRSAGPVAAPLPDGTGTVAGYVDDGRIPGSGSAAGFVTDTTGGGPANNAEWETEAISLLSALGYGAGLAQEAITKAFSGEPLTLSQRAAVQLALTRLGNPPGGMPPLTSGPADDTPTTPTTPTPAAPPRYPGNPRPTQTIDYVAPASTTWTEIVGRFPAGSTNDRALKAWHASHGGKLVYTGWYNLPKGAVIKVPNMSPGIL
jgi:hypothetical protein